MSKKCIAIKRLMDEEWFSSEKEATAWIMERNVLVNEQPIYTPNEKISTDGVIRLKKEYKRKYVNKGGLKLEKCLADFKISLNNIVALDCGASTGGFTDCLIQHGAKSVYAVDAGYGQLAGRLASDTRIVNMEKVNLGDEILLNLSPKPDLITLDLSYLSLKKAILLCLDILGDHGTVLCLVKPLFEVNSSEIRRNGDINKKEVIHDVLQDLCNYFIDLNLNIIGVTWSAVTGNNGTLEYFIGVTWGCSIYISANNEIDSMIRESIEKSFSLHNFRK